MKIDAVRKLTRKRINERGESVRKYAINLNIQPNTMYLFLDGKGAYAECVPKAVLADLALTAQTETNYYKAQS